MDQIDLAQKHQQDDIDHALEARRVRQPGLSACSQCDEPISSLRRDMGARLCIDCQRAAELHAKSWNRRS